MKISQEKSKKINTKTKKIQDQPGRKYERKEEQKWDLFHGLFSSRASRKKNAYIKKNVQKNRKIVKNLLMYDKKNFLPTTYKKSPKNKIAPNKVKNEKEWKKSKTTREILKLVFFDFTKNGNEKKRIKTKIKSQDYETFFCLSKTFCFTSCIKNLCPT